VLVGRPLYDNPADARYHVPPQEWDGLVKALERDNNVLLHGARGSGKTTLLRQMQRVLRGQGERVVFVDVSAVTEPFAFASRVHDALKGRSGVASAIHDSSSLDRDPGGPNSSTGGTSRQLYDTLVDLGDEVEPTILLIDASGAASAVYGVFGRMRDTVWQLPHRWLVAVDDDELTSALRPPADAFFDRVVALKPLSMQQLLDLLQRRTDELPAHVLSWIAADAGGNPRTAVRAANDALVNGTNPSGGLSTRAHLLDAAGRLGRPHGMLMAELLDLGQASPSDEVLLERLGLTRARVNALLQQLAVAGLVESGVERSDRPGRPRTVYRPALGGAR
jgi:energy-coupling factor transporter ATP-binding protein EcfA2